MPIHFRCYHCDQLLSISRRKAGHVVPCPMCDADLMVPQSDQARPRVEGKTAAGAPVPQAPETGFDGEEEFLPRKVGTDFEEMDLTPMVDVTFLLLIFFMITASFSLQKTLEVPPPDPDREGAAQSIQTLDDLLDESIKVEVDERNVISLEDEQVSDPRRLADAIRDRMRADLKTELVLTADPRALHETVVLVIDAANEAGMQKIRLATQAGDGDWIEQ